MIPSVATIKNFVLIDYRVGTAGQPTPDQFGAVRDAGYEVVINLLPREQDNALKDEADLIRTLGLEYRYIPVIWTAPQPQDFNAFCDLMREIEGKKIFIHCAMNMRVTAFYSSYGLKHLGWSLEQADALVSQVWGAHPNSKMNDTWGEFIARIHR